MQHTKPPSDTHHPAAFAPPALGLALLVLVALAAGVLIRVSAQQHTAWFVGGHVVISLLAVAAYLVAVYRPLGRMRAEHQSFVKRSGIQAEALGKALAELRHGDLIAAIAPTEGIETELERGVEGAARALSGLIQQIQSSSVEVATSAYAVQETAAELASGSSQQAAAVVEITATTEQLARTAGQIAANVAGQAELSAQAEQAGDAGAAAVEAAVAGVEAVREGMAAIASRADILGSRSREIYKVLDLINEIAHETHILSLNAAIEASAAGTHGERFSVVADEVRRLAERSRESVDSVRALLDDFSSAIRGMVVATEEGNKAAEQVEQQSQSTEDAIDHLRAALADTARTAREISLATQEQQTASDQVVLTLKEVSEVIQRMADGLKNFTGTAERLNHVALSIQLLTQSFRLDSPHSMKDQILKWAANLVDYSGNLEAIEGRLAEIIRSCPYLEMIYMADLKGILVTYVANQELIGDRGGSGAVGAGHNIGERPWFAATMRDERTTVTPVYESLMTGDQCFTIATCIHDLNGQPAGVMGVDVNVRNWTRM